MDTDYVMTLKSLDHEKNVFFFRKGWENQI